MGRLLLDLLGQGVHVDFKIDVGRDGQPQNKYLVDLGAFDGKYFELPVSLSSFKGIL